MLIRVLQAQKTYCMEAVGTPQEQQISLHEREGPSIQCTEPSTTQHERKAEIDLHPQRLSTNYIAYCTQFAGCSNLPVQCTELPESRGPFAQCTDKADELYICVPR